MKKFDKILHLFQQMCIDMAIRIKLALKIST